MIASCHCILHGLNHPNGPMEHAGIRRNATPLNVQRIAAVLAAGGTAAAAATLTDFKFQLFGTMMPAVRVFDPETAHKLTMQAARYGMLPSDTRKDDPRLHVNLWGRTFTNPIGVAAGFDKDAEGMDAILNMGVGFMEVGAML
jgi:hypothetical protein